MKNIALLLFLIFIVNPIISQNYEWTADRGHAIHDLALLSNGDVFLASGNSHGDFGFYVNPSGGDIINGPFDFLWSDHMQVHETVDGEYLVAFNEFDCDVIFTGFCKFNQDWEMLWEGDSFSAKTQINSFSNGDIIYSNGTRLFKVTSDNIFLWDLELGEEIFSIAVDQNDDIYVALSSGLFKLNTDGIDLDIQALVVLDEIKVNASNRVVGRTGNNLMVFDENLSELANKDMGMPVLDFDLKEDKIVCLISDEIMVTDYLLNNVDGFIWDNPALIPAQVVWREDDEILIAGREKYNTIESASFVKSFLLNGTTLEFFARCSHCFGIDWKY